MCSCDQRGRNVSCDECWPEEAKMEKLVIDRHAEGECEVKGCHRTAREQVFVGRQAHRVDVCEFHADDLRRGVEAEGT